jgi:hypothetical protein
LTDSESLPTGDPGRPSKGWPLYSAEFERRCIAGSVAPKIAEEARLLRTWFTLNHPDAQLPTVGNIENRIRPFYQAYKATILHPTK